MTDELNIVKYSCEEWKFIEGYDEGYKISNFGRVYSIKRGRLKAVTTDSTGYLVVGLYDSGSGKKVTIHRLVALHFIPNPDNLPEVNHKDEVKTNNLQSNLEWCDHRYNMEYSNAKYYEVITPDGTVIDVFNLAKFCRENNLDDSNMVKVSKGKKSHCKGYRIWEHPNAKIPTNCV